MPLLFCLPLSPDIFAIVLSSAVMILRCIIPLRAGRSNSCLYVMSCTFRCKVLHVAVHVNMQQACVYVNVWVYVCATEWAHCQHLGACCTTSYSTVCVCLLSSKKVVKLEVCVTHICALMLWWSLPTSLPHDFNHRFRFNKEGLNLSIYWKTWFHHRPAGF